GLQLSRQPAARRALLSHHLRLADTNQRAAIAALGFIDGGWCTIAIKKRASIGDDAQGQRPQFIVERDNLAPPRLAIVERAQLDADAQHLFQAQRLGTELHLVGAMRLGPATLVLDGPDHSRLSR